MGSMFGGAPQASAVPAAAPVAATPAAIVYQSDDPYAPNYKPPVGAVLSPAQKAAQEAKDAANRPLAVANPEETDEERQARLRRSSLILGAGYETWGGGSDNGASGGAADAGRADSGGSADGSAY